jgi:hypothetical protein
MDDQLRRRRRFRFDLRTLSSMNENPYNPPQTEPARKRCGAGKFIDQLDDSQKDRLMLAIGLFVIAPLFYFLFSW